MNTFWIKAIDDEVFILRCEVDTLKAQVKTLRLITMVALDNMVVSGAMLKTEKDSLVKDLARAAGIGVELDGLSDAQEDGNHGD